MTDNNKLAATIGLSMQNLRPASSLLGIGLLCLASALNSGCANTVQYGEASKPATVTTEFGVTDLQNMASKMTDNMINNPTVMSYTYGHRPTLALDSLTNNTGRPLNTGVVGSVVSQKLQTLGAYQLIEGNSVANAKSRLRLQSPDALDDVMNAQKVCSSVGADLFLYGDVSEVVRTHPTAKEVYYRVSMRLLDSKSGGVVWQEEKEFLKSQKKIVFGI